MYGKVGQESYDPPPERNWTAGGGGEAGSKIKLCNNKLRSLVFRVVTVLRLEQ